MAISSPFNNIGAHQFTGGSGAQQATANTIDGGLLVGNSFDGRGNDFLSPGNILGNIDDFSNSIRPISSNTPYAQISFKNPYGKNPDSPNILGSTNSFIDSVMSAGFGSNINYQVPIFQGGGFIQPVPDLGVNPDPVKILLGTTFFQNGIHAPYPQFDPRNFNPFQWHNPDPLNVLLGTTGAGNTVIGGGTLPFPPFNPFPSSPWPMSMSALGTPITVYPTGGQTAYGPYIPNTSVFQPHGNTAPSFNYPFPYSFAAPVQPPMIPVKPVIPVCMPPQPPLCPPPVCPPVSQPCAPGHGYLSSAMHHLGEAFRNLMQYGNCLPCSTA